MPAPIEQRSMWPQPPCARRLLPLLGVSRVDRSGADAEFLDGPLLLEVHYDAVPLPAALAVIDPGGVLPGTGAADVFDLEDLGLPQEDLQLPDRLAVVAMTLHDLRQVVMQGREVRDLP